MAILFPAKMGHCEIFTCTKRAKYVVGRSDATTPDRFHICADHAKDMLTLEKLPEELKDHVLNQVPTYEPDTTNETPIEPDKEQTLSDDNQPDTKTIIEEDTDVQEPSKEQTEVNTQVENENSDNKATDDEGHKCEVCEKVFTSERGLKIHMNTHGE